MKKMIKLMILTTLFIILGFFFINNFTCVRAYNVGKESESAPNENENDIYDVITHDIFGNTKFYKHSDFEYNNDVVLQEYDYSLRNEEEVNRNNRDEDDEDDPYEMYYSLPYSAICLVYSSFDTNNDGIADVTYSCSGAMVAPNIVLTSCEYTYNNTYGFPINMTFMPGAYTDEYGTLVKPFGEATLVSASMGSYHDTFDANDDWAIVSISSDLGYNSGWLSLSDTLYNNSSVHPTGYSYLDGDYWISRYNCLASNVQTYKFNHNSNPLSTLTGGPVVDSNDQMIYGIHTGIRLSINNVTYSQACRVSVYIKNWIQGNGVLELRIFSIDGGSGSSFNFGGHSWLTVKNNSSFSVQIGKSCLAPQQSSSLGTWGNIVHQGLYYNLEYNRSTSYSANVSCISYIFVSQWNWTNSYVVGNDVWALNNNCATFAVTVWNSIVTQNQFIITGIETPEKLYNCILAVTHDTNVSINGNNNVGYYIGNTFYPSVV